MLRGPQRRISTTAYLHPALLHWPQLSFSARFSVFDFRFSNFAFRLFSVGAHLQMRPLFGFRISLFGF